MSIRSSDRFWPIVLTLMLTDFIASLEANMIFSALPAIAREFGGFGSVGWLISAFTLVQAVSAVIGGKLGDMFGRRLILVIVLLLSAVGSLISAMSEPLGLIIAGRSLQGVSGAILPLSFGIIRENTSADRAGFGAGMVVGAYAISGAFGFVLGGWFADQGYWRGIFYLTAVLPLVAIAAILLFVPQSSRSRDMTARDIDFIGALTLLPAIASLLIGLTSVGKIGWSSWDAVMPLAIGVGALTFWVWYELRRPAPLVNLRRLRNRTVLLAILCFFVIGCGPLQNALIILGIMQQPAWTGIGLGLAGAAAGFVKFPGNFASVFAGGIGGKLSQRMGPRIVAIGAGVTLLLGWSMIFLGSTNLWIMIAASLLCSCGVTVMMATTPALLMEVTPQEETGEVTGLAYLVRAIGMSVGTQMISVMLASSTVTAHGSDQSYPSAGAYHLAIGSVIVLILVSILLTIAIPRKVPKRQESRA